MVPIVELDWKHQYRIISSKYPPINFFERLVDPALMEELYYIESLTNDRLRQEIGDISLVPVEERVTGPGSTPVMAAFTHIGISSRFSDGSYGIYYAAKNMDTALAESIHNRTCFLSYTKEEAGEINMRVYIGEVVRPLHDVRGNGHEDLHLPDDRGPAQVFGRKMKDANSWGIVYRSVRHPEGECIAALRPPAVTVPRQGPHYSYAWDGSRITRVYQKKLKMNL